MNSSTEEEVKNMGSRARRETLLADEKKAMKMQLLEFIKKHPAGIAPKKDKRVFVPLFFARRPLMRNVSYALAGFAVIVVMGGGVAAAANRAMPGDALYPVKLNVNEQVLSWMAASNESKARLHIALAKRRLEEIEKAAPSQSFNEEAASQAKVSFNRHVGAAEASIKAIGKERGSEISAELNAGFESVLRAHVKIMGNVIEKEKKRDEKKAEAVKDFQKNVADRIDSVARSRDEYQEKIFAYNSSNMQSYATQKRAEAQQRLKETAEFVIAKKENLSQDAHQSALGNIAVASNLIAQGQERMDAQEYRAAVRLFQKAINVSQEIQIGVLANEKLNINLESKELNELIERGEGLEINLKKLFK